MSRVSSALAQAVIQRANRLCEYCQTPQQLVVEMDIDHIIPRSLGGTTDFDNLCLACSACNTFKHHFTTGFDEMDKQTYPLFNPRQQSWSEHFEWIESGIRLAGQTAIGRVTIARLRMNRDGILQARRLWVGVGWHPPKNGRFPLDEG